MIGLTVRCIVPVRARLYWLFGGIVLASGVGPIFVSNSNRNRFELLIVDISVWLIAAENELQVIDDGLLASLLYR